MENIDCICEVLSNLPIRDRELCRLISNKWLCSVDQLARCQRSLNIIGHQSRNQSPINNNTIYWPHKYISYHLYCLILKRFPNLRSITFDRIHHWTDHQFEELTRYCSHLTSIAFVHCQGLGQSSITETINYFNNVTLNGWNRLIHSFGQQLTHLTVQDCDIDDKQLAIIINGFRMLQYLDISDNNRLNEANALSNLPMSIRSVKLGPKLNDHLPLDGSNNRNVPIKALLYGPGRTSITELYIQGNFHYNSNNYNQLILLKEFSNLTKLVINFILPNIDQHYQNDHQNFTALKYLKNVSILELYQHNTNNCSISSLTTEEMESILLGSPNCLQKFIFNCDIYCDSPWNDQLVAHLRSYQPNLQHLHICPGTVHCTDKSLNIFSTFPHLSHLSLVEFTGISSNGIVEMLKNSSSLTECIIKDCCEYVPESKYSLKNKFIESIKNIHEENPNRFIQLTITSHVNNQKTTIKIPEENPKIIIKILDQSHINRMKRFNDEDCYWKQYYKHLFNESNRIATIIFEKTLSTLNFLKIWFTLFLLIIAFIIYFFHHKLFNKSSSSSSSQHQQFNNRNNNSISMLTINIYFLILLIISSLLFIYFIIIILSLFWMGFQN